MWFECFEISEIDGSLSDVMLELAIWKNWSVIWSVFAGKEESRNGCSGCDGIYEESKECQGNENRQVS